MLDLTLTTLPESPTAEAISWTSCLQVGLGSWTEHLCGLAISFPSKVYVSISEYSWVSWFETSSGQLSLAIYSILCGAPTDFLAWFGIKCSSFCKMNIGTSMRSPFASIGCYDHPSVKMANAMLERTLPKYTKIYTNMKVDETMGIVHNFQLIGYICFGSLFFVWLILGSTSLPSEPLWTAQTRCPSRTVLLILLVTILGETWALEQPSGSLLEFYPAFRHMLATIFSWGGDYAVGILGQPMFIFCLYCKIADIHL